MLYIQLAKNNNIVYYTGNISTIHNTKFLIILILLKEGLKINLIESDVSLTGIDLYFSIET